MEFDQKKKLSATFNSVDEMVPENHYIVSEVVGVRKVNGCVEYCLKWEGYEGYIIKFHFFFIFKLI